MTPNVDELLDGFLTSSLNPMLAQCVAGQDERLGDILCLMSEIAFMRGVHACAARIVDEAKGPDREVAVNVLGAEAEHKLESYKARVLRIVLQSRTESAR